MAHFHIPKPLHGWRAFVGEVGIIVLGVLIALSAEQAATWVQRYAEVTDARAALRAEISKDVATLETGIEEERCLSGQFDGWSAWAHGGPHPSAFRNVGFPSLDSSAWETVKSGAASLMPLRERLAYAQFYDGVANHGWLLNNERDVYIRLGGEGGREALDSATAGRLLEDLTQARILGYVRTWNAEGMLRGARDLGVGAVPLDRDTREFLKSQCAKR